MKLGLTTNSCDSNRCLHESLEGQSLCKPRLVRGNKIGYRASRPASYLLTNRKKQAIHPTHGGQSAGWKASFFGR